MRTVIQISAAFLVLDGRDKSPVREASILVDGARRRCIRKGDGHVVFIDLSAVEHTFEIIAPGFRAARRTVRPGSGTLPEVVVMQYAPDSPQLAGVSHYRFRLAKGGVPLSDSRVKVTLLTGCGALRVVDSAKKGQQELALSGGYSPMLLYQNYEAEPAGTVMLTGYDQGSGCYELREPLGKALAAGAALRPRWTLDTDREGTAVLSSVGLFMQREELEFSFETEGAQVKKLTLPPPAGACPAAVEF